MNLLFTDIGGKFKFQVQDSFLEYFFLENLRFEKHVALSEKKNTFSTARFDENFVCKLLICTRIKIKTREIVGVWKFKCNFIEDPVELHCAIIVSVDCKIQSNLDWTMKSSKNRLS